MFGSLKALFKAIGGLAESITETKRLFDSANEQLRQRLAVDAEVSEEVPALAHQPELLEAKGNGRKAKR